MHHQALDYFPALFPCRIVLEPEMILVGGFVPDDEMLLRRHTARRIYREQWVVFPRCNVDSHLIPAWTELPARVRFLVQRVGNMDRIFDRRIRKHFSSGKYAVA